MASLDAPLDAHISSTCLAEFHEVMFAIRFGLCYRECQQKHPWPNPNYPFSMCQGKGKSFPIMFRTPNYSKKRTCQKFVKVSLKKSNNSIRDIKPPPSILAIRFGQKLLVNRAEVCLLLCGLPSLSQSSDRP